jgi:hypothetical protein
MQLHTIFALLAAAANAAVIDKRELMSKVDFFKSLSCGGGAYTLSYNRERGFVDGGCRTLDSTYYTARVTQLAPRCTGM